MTRQHLGMLIERKRIETDEDLAELIRLARLRSILQSMPKRLP